MKSPQATTKDRGYAILFAILMISIILAITLGILNIAVKEFNFTITARDSYISFFAADSVGECALYAYKSSTPDAPASIQCDTINGPQTITPSSVSVGNVTRYAYAPDISVLNGCGRVEIVIDNSVSQVTTTTINAKGYNIACNQMNSNVRNKVERLLSYEFVQVGGGNGLGNNNGGNNNGGNNNGGNNNGGNPGGGVGGIQINNTGGGNIGNLSGLQFQPTSGGNSGQ